MTQAIAGIYNLLKIEPIRTRSLDQNMKGVILSGGTGSRLYPLTMITSKQLLPVYDKPMIYYPLSILMLDGIKDILIISTPDDTPRFECLLGNGFGKILREAAMNAETNKRASVFGYYVHDPGRFRVVAFDKNGKATSIEEKPAVTKSNYAVTGLYFYPSGVSKKAHNIKPSARGELEITTLNEMYLNEGILNVQLLGRGFAWLDTGTMDSLVAAAKFVKMIADRQGITISASEEIAYLNGWIDKEALMKSAERC